jgi:hypothetical protein
MSRPEASYEENNSYAANKTGLLLGDPYNDFLGEADVRACDSYA